MGNIERPHGLLEPSISPWAIPVVLEKKKMENVVSVSTTDDLTKWWNPAHTVYPMPDLYKIIRQIRRDVKMFSVFYVLRGGGGWQFHCTKMCENTRLSEYVEVHFNSEYSPSILKIVRWFKALISYNHGCVVLGNQDLT